MAGVSQSSQSGQSGSSVGSDNLEVYFFHSILFRGSFCMFAYKFKDFGAVFSFDGQVDGGPRVR